MSTPKNCPILVCSEDETSFNYGAMVEDSRATPKHPLRSSETKSVGFCTWRTCMYSSAFLRTFPSDHQNSLAIKHDISSSAMRRASDPFNSQLTFFNRPDARIMSSLRFVRYGSSQRRETKDGTEISTI